MTYDEITKVKTLYQVNNVPRGFKYWKHILLEKCYGMFNYQNLPDSLPADKIEQSLILTGWAGIFKHKEFGLVTCWGGLSGIDKYYLPTKYVYAQPALGSGNLDIDKNCVIMYNSQIDQYERNGLFNMIQRYARLLADIESSLDIIIVNSRATKLTVVDNQQVAKTVDEVMAKIQRGDFASINKNTILDAFKTVDFTDNKNQLITELLLCRDKMLNSFLAELGIKTIADKKERMISDEVDATDQLLTINVADLLRWRKIGIDKINTIFGEKITVDLSDEYKTKREDVSIEN